MRLRCPALVIVALLAVSMAFAGDQKPPAGAPKMDQQTRLQLIRAISSEIVYMRRPLPMGKKGIILKDGAITPSEREIQDMIAMYGPAVKAGDQARITNIQFKGDNKIIFEINGGPQKSKKWYQRITVSGSSGSTPIDPTQDDNLNARGSMVTLEFDKYVPQVGPQELKKLLEPVFNFDAKSAVEAYLDTVPPKVKDAIKNKQVLVGMNREMVMYALGRPPKKYRQDNYEEWIYGTPPEQVQFVRFTGDEVVRLEIMKVNGEKEVRTAKEIDLKEMAPASPAGGTQTAEGTTSASGKQGPQKVPSLRRPGEAAPESTPAGNQAPLPRDPQRSPLDPPLSPTSGPGAAPPPPGASPHGIPPP